MYNQMLGYDDSIDLNIDAGLIEGLSWIGLSSLIRNSGLFQNKSFSAIMFSRHIIEKYSSVIADQNNLNVICSRAAKNKVNLYNHPVWNDFLEQQYEHGINNNSICHEAFRTSDHYINYILDWKKEVNWMEIYNTYFAKQKSSSYITQPFINSIEKYFSQNPLCARISIEADLFDAEHKPDANVRTIMYTNYIRAGFLDKKKARKIRSESSEYTSHKGLSALIEVWQEQPNLYPNIDELLLQFTDTKYHSVQEYMAAHAPFNLLYAFVGFDSHHAKRILERRMQDGK